MVRVGNLGRYLTIGRSARAASIIMSMVLLASCNPATTGSSPDGAQLDIMEKVESVIVEQSLFGRLFDYGSIVVRGTGSGIEGLHYIAKPIALRSSIVVR